MHAYEEIDFLLERYALTLKALKNSVNTAEYLSFIQNIKTLFKDLI